jgi:PAS domain S-box-containing protein
MNSLLQILYLENDVVDAELVRDTLAAEGIVCELTRVETESGFVEALQEGGFNLILADYALPSFDGVSALRIALRRWPHLPFIFVSGTMGEEVAIEALKIGATDYVLKTRLTRLAPAVRRAQREAEERAERKKAEEALRRSERELRQVIETIPAMVWSALPDASNASMNQRWADYTGSPAHGLGWQTAVHPDDLKRHMEAFRASSDAGVPFKDEVRLRGADGEYRWFLVQGAPLRDEQGKILKWYGIVTDIEDRKRTEQELKTSQTWLAEAQVLTRTGSFVWDIRTNDAVYLSDEWYRVYGLDPEKDKNSGWKERWTRIHPEDGPRWQAAVVKASTEKRSYELEYRLVFPDGSIKYVHVIGHPVVNASGEVTQFMGSVTDITERKQAEEAAHAAKARFEGIVQIAQDAIISVDSQQRIILFNQGAETIFGYRQADVIGRPLELLLPGRFQDVHRQHIEDFFRSPETARTMGQRREVSGRRVDGSEFPAEASISKLDLGSEWVYTVILRDITERKKAEDALRRSEAYLADAQRLSHTGSWAWDPARSGSATMPIGHLDSPSLDTGLYWSEEMFRIFGFDPGQGVNSEQAWRRLHAEDADRVYEAFQNAAREKSEIAAEYRIALPDGSLKHIQVIGHPVLDEKGEIVEYVGTAADSTDRKRAEQERERLRQLEAELAHVNRVSMMGELSASLAHELRQPIAASVIHAQTCRRWLAREEPQIERARQAALNAVKDALRAAEIIERLRSLYTKGAPASRELVDVNDLFAEMLALLRSEATRFSVSLRAEASVKLPRVSADRVQLQQVLLNLMLNGIEAMKDTGGELTIRSQLTLENQLLISVRDRGVGLPAGKADQIFDAFFTTKPQGSGMGLAISRSIIESHGGRLWATANDGQGATFHFTLPPAPVELCQVSGVLGM